MDTIVTKDGVEIVYKDWGSERRAAHGLSSQLAVVRGATHQSLSRCSPPFLRVESGSWTTASTLTKPTGARSRHPVGDRSVALLIPYTQGRHLARPAKKNRLPFWAANPGCAAAK
jgi:hypothetical protein